MGTAQIRIDPLTIPASMGEDGATAFAEMVALTNGISRDTRGNDDFVYAAEDVLPRFQPHGFEERITFVARVSGLMVGSAVVRFPMEPDAVTAMIDVRVAPALRRHGVGSALLARSEDLVAAGGRTTVGGYTEHPPASLGVDGPRLAGPAGSAVIPQASPSAAFLTGHGYRLGQAARSSECPLPIPDQRLDGIRRDAERVAGPDYRLLAWCEHAPAEYAEGFAALRSQMAEDVPPGGVTIERERWTLPRLRNFEQLMVERKTPLLTTAALHPATGELVAYTELVAPADSDAVEQHDTLVVRGHRGRRLGVLIKAENLRRLRLYAPGVSKVLTWNADENTHMIAVNDVLGFRPKGYIGKWQKVLPEIVPSSPRKQS